MSFNPQQYTYKNPPPRRSHRSSYTTWTQTDLKLLNQEVLRLSAQFYELKREKDTPLPVLEEAARLLVAAREAQEKALGGVARPARGLLFETPPLWPLKAIETEIAKGNPIPPLNRKTRRALIARQRRGETFTPDAEWSAE